VEGRGEATALDVVCDRFSLEKRNTQHTTSKGWCVELPTPEPRWPSGKGGSKGYDFSPRGRTDPRPGKKGKKSGPVVA